MADREKFKPLRFGTSGLRGLVTEMTDMECYINTMGFIKFLKKRGDTDESRNKIAIAGDLRSSTPRIMAAVSKAIEDSECVTINCGKCPAPTLAYYAMQEGFPSIMVTGSHIPDDRNGIKFNKRSGEVLKEDESDILANVADARKEEYEKSDEETQFDDAGMFKESPMLPLETGEAIEVYIRRYTEAFPSDALSGVKIAQYQHSAVGRDILKEILEKLGAEVVPAARSEEFVAVDTEKVTDQTRALLKKLAAEYKPFAVVSTDGDSDRPLLADENGEFLPGDKLGVLASIYLKPDFVAIPISANDAVVSSLGKKGIEVVQTKIGSPYVIKAMNDELVKNPKTKTVSWESNGGFLTGSDWTINGKTLKALPTRDTALPLLSVLLLAREKEVSVSELIKTSLPSRETHADLLREYPREISQEIVKSFSPPKDLGVAEVDFERKKVRYLDRRIEELGTDKELAGSAEKIKDELGKKYFTPDLGFTPIVTLNFIDGIRIVFENGDVSHLRPSGNAPEFRNYATADTKERAEEIVKVGLDKILPKMREDIG
ncbi:MAG: phosphomannomutase [Candidatus Omnitrophota bacterium]|jgi:phosphomannomutase